MIHLRVKFGGSTIIINDFTKGGGEAAPPRPYEAQKAPAWIGLMMYVHLVGCT